MFGVSFGRFRLPSVTSVQEVASSALCIDLETGKLHSYKRVGRSAWTTLEQVALQECMKVEMVFEVKIACLAHELQMW